MGFLTKPNQTVYGMELPSAGFEVESTFGVINTEMTDLAKNLKGPETFNTLLKLRILNGKAQNLNNFRLEMNNICLWRIMYKLG